jgi:hypothetical protein
LARGARSVRQDTRDGCVSAKCLAFIALTAVRLTEARGAKWSEIDFDAATWTISAERMKMRAEHIVRSGSELATKNGQTGPRANILGRGENAGAGPKATATIWSTLVERSRKTVLG